MTTQLTPRFHAVVKAVSRTARSAVDIANSTGISLPNVKAAIVTLRNKGYVEVENSEVQPMATGRFFRYKVTEAGKLAMKARAPEKSVPIATVTPYSQVKHNPLPPERSIINRPEYVPPKDNNYRAGALDHKKIPSRGV